MNVSRKPGAGMRQSAWHAALATLLLLPSLAHAGCKIYFGSSGYNVAGRKDGDRIYFGSSGYDVAFRVDGLRLYYGSSGYSVAFRGENCTPSQLGLGALVL